MSSCSLALIFVFLIDFGCVRAFHLDLQPSDVQISKAYSYTCLADGQDAGWGCVQVAEVVAPSRQSLDAGPGEITAAPEDGATAHSSDGGTSRSSLLHGVGARRLGLVSDMGVCDECF